MPLQRIKTEFIGIYYRYGKNRKLPNGEPDCCFDICYQRADGQQTYEKVGWVSEGYTVEDAIRIRGNRVRQIRHPELSLPPGTSTLTVGDAWNAYKKGWLPNLKRSREVQITYEKYLSREFGKRPIASIKPQEIEIFKQTLLGTTSQYGKTLKPGSVRNILACLRQIISKALEWEMAPGVTNPVVKLRVPGADRKRQKYLTQEEARQLLQGLKELSPQMHDIAYVALYTGMRLGEVLALQVEDIDFGSRTIHIRDGKTGSRTAYFPRRLETVLRERCGKCEPTSRNLFFSKRGNPLKSKVFSRDFAKAVEKIGLNKNVSDSLYKVTFHTLRHTFCSWLAMSGIPIQVVGALAGHKELEMTQRYAKLSSATKRNALDCLENILEETETEKGRHKEEAREE